MSAPVCLCEARLLEKDAVLIEAKLLAIKQLSRNACQVAFEDQLPDVLVIPAAPHQAAVLALRHPSLKFRALI